MADGYKIAHILTLFIPHANLHRLTLLLAGTYNLAWGLFTALAPGWFFQFARCERNGEAIMTPPKGDIHLTWPINSCSQERTVYFFGVSHYQWQSYWPSLSEVPTGWHMEPFIDLAGWHIEDNPSRAHGTGRFQARSNTIGVGNEAFLLAPPIEVNSANPVMSTTFYTWQSSATANTMNLYLYNHDAGGLFVLPDNQSFFPGTTPILNQAIDVDYPANLSSTIAVGASTDWDYRSHYSQYGAALDIVAPSGGGFAGIASTDITGGDGYVAGDYVGGLTGTSFAAPLAAGIAALLLSRNPDLSADDVRSIMQNSTDKVGGNIGATAYDTNGFNQFYGFGRVNALAAVEAVPAASGDYNLDGTVDAADYTVWRNSLGATVTPYTGADGDRNGLIEAADYQVWKSHFGQTIAMPLPASLAIAPRGSIDTGAYSATTTNGNGFAGRLPPQIPSSRSLHALLRAGGEASIQPTLPIASDLALLALPDEPEHKRTSQVEFTLAIDNDGEDDKALVAELALDAIFNGP